MSAIKDYGADGEVFRPRPLWLIAAHEWHNKWRDRSWWCWSFTSMLFLLLLLRIGVVALDEMNNEWMACCCTEGRRTGTRWCHAHVVMKPTRRSDNQQNWGGLQGRRFCIWWSMAINKCDVGWEELVDVDVIEWELRAISNLRWCDGSSMRAARHNAHPP